MKRRQLLKAGGAGALALGAIQAAHADERTFHWKLVMSWPKKFPGLATTMEWFCEEIAKASNGRLRITIYGAGELVPPFEVFNAVSEGTAEMGHGAAYYWKGKIPEAELFTSVPFGMMTEEMTSWMIDGDGLALLGELYKPFGVLPFLGGNTTAQMGGWFNREIESPDDLKGLKIRMPGIAGEVYRMAGATPVALPGGEIFTAMQSGVIDATDWVGPWNDQAFGLYKVARYYYNGWQEPGALAELSVNEKAFLRLPEDLQVLVKNMSLALNQKMISAFHLNNARAYRNLIEKQQVQVRDFPERVIKLFRENSERYLKKYAAQSAIAERIAASYRTFLQQQIAVFANRDKITRYRSI